MIAGKPKDSLSSEKEPPLNAEVCAKASGGGQGDIKIWVFLLATDGVLQSIDFNDVGRTNLTNNINSGHGSTKLALSGIRGQTLARLNGVEDFVRGFPPLSLPFSLSSGRVLCVLFLSTGW